MSHSPIPSFKDDMPKTQSHDIFVKSFETQSDHAVVFTAQRVGNFSTRAGHNNQGRGCSSRGDGCNNFSHNSNSNSRSCSSSNNKSLCQICGKQGHVAIVCWDRYGQAVHLTKAFSSCSIQDPSNLDWYPDNGATSHITNNANALDNATPYSGNDGVLVGNGESLPVTHIDSISALNSFNSLSLCDILVVPELTKNLISISSLTLDLNCCVIFVASSFTIQDLQTRAVLGTSRHRNGLYVLDRGQQAFLTLLR